MFNNMTIKSRLVLVKKLPLAPISAAASVSDASLSRSSGGSFGSATSPLNQLTTPKNWLKAKSANSSFEGRRCRRVTSRERNTTRPRKSTTGEPGRPRPRPGAGTPQLTLKASQSAASGIAPETSVISTNATAFGTAGANRNAWKPSPGRCTPSVSKRFSTPCPW